MIDLAGATGRRHGGAGIAILGPQTLVHCSSASNFKIKSDEHLDAETWRDLEILRGRLEAWRPTLCVRVSIEKSPRQHIGLGSKTALLLAIISAVDRHAHIGLTKEQKQLLSNRGGTSGIGVHTFFQGGLIVDCGHASSSERFQPSSASRGKHRVPLVAARTSVPTNWRFLLALPPGRLLSAARELSFFAQHTPIPADEALQSLALVYHGLLPAFLTEDLRAVKKALAGLHRTGFKLRELSAQSQPVRSLFRELELLPNVAVGMSSLGPLLYVVLRKEDRVSLEEARRACARNAAEVIGCYRAANSGAILQEGPSGS